MYINTLNSGNCDTPGHVSSVGVPSTLQCNNLSEFHHFTEITLQCTYQKIHKTHTLCPKINIPDIFDSNLKTNYYILIIFGTNIFDTNIFDTTCHQTLLSFPPYLMYASALPKKSRPNEMCGEINRKPEKMSPTLLIAN